MASTLREALDDVVTKITWRPDHTALVHDSEALNTLIGYIVMTTSLPPSELVEGLDAERVRECFTERTDCIHGAWDSVTGDHFAEHLAAALTPRSPG